MKNTTIEQGNKIEFLENKNKLLKDLQKLADIGCWDYDLITKKLIWSDETYKIFGYKVNEIEPSLNIILLVTHIKNKTEINNFINDILNKTKVSGSYSNNIICPKGEIKYININYTVKTNANNDPINIIGSVLDLTKIKQTEKELKDIEKKYKVLSETANDFIFIIGNNGLIEYVNSCTAKQIKKKPKEIIGLELIKLFQKDFYEKQMFHVNEVINTGKPVVIETKSFFDIQNKWLSTSLSPIFDENKKVKSILGISRDITKRVNAEQLSKESEERYRDLVEQAADSIFVGDTKGNFIDINSKACELTGYSKKELLTMNMRDLFAKNELIKKPLRYDLLLKGEIVISERILKTKNKDSVIIEMNTVRMSNGSYQAIMRNISERKKSELILLQQHEGLEKKVRQRTRQFEKANIELKKEIIERERTEKLMKFQLDEKEILLKEVHHRVKNNMQVIISLLNLQAATIDDNAIHELYRESQNRIKSMALIHEKLYQSKDLAYIDFSEYVKSLTSYLAHTYLSCGKAVNISTKTQKIPLEYDTVISLGLIINELVSNSMKYAFNGNARGKIEISLKKIKDNLLDLCVSDNGVGFPDDINFRDTKSLGLQLVCSLAEQIGGTISLCNEKGTKFSIQFYL